jgi:hypothetical protein
MKCVQRLDRKDDVLSKGRSVLCGGLQFEFSLLLRSGGQLAANFSCFVSVVPFSWNKLRAVRLQELTALTMKMAVFRV